MVPAHLKEEDTAAQAEVVALKTRLALIEATPPPASFLFMMRRAWRWHSPGAAWHRAFSQRRVLAQPAPESHPHIMAAGEVTPGLAASEYAERCAESSVVLPPNRLSAATPTAQASCPRRPSTRPIGGHLLSGATLVYVARRAISMCERDCHFQS